jgi:predicted aldo/keto reductase-like oxidoreductase
VLPIWGIQRQSELDEFLSYQQDAPHLTPSRRELIAAEKAELSGKFCRGCGYCLPCAADIDIPTVARISLLLRRSPTDQWLEPEWVEKVNRVNDCTHCNHCLDHCPYGLQVPDLLRRNYEDYQTFLKSE